MGDALQPTPLPSPRHPYRRLSHQYPGARLQVSCRLLCPPGFGVHSAAVVARPPCVLHLWCHHACFQPLWAYLENALAHPHPHAQCHTHTHTHVHTYTRTRTHARPRKCISICLVRSWMSVDTAIYCCWICFHVYVSRIARFKSNKLATLPLMWHTVTRVLLRVPCVDLAVSLHGHALPCRSSRCCYVGPLAATSTSPRAV